MARLAIFLLGSFQGTLDGAELRGFESDKARGLLAYLAVEVAAAAQKRGLERDLWETAGQLLNELGRRGLD